MTRFTKLPTQALAIGLFAITGLAAANPMAAFVDCTDSFWEVACSSDVESVDVKTDIDADMTDVVVGEPVRIDNDVTCVDTDDGFIICHT